MLRYHYVNDNSHNVYNNKSLVPVISGHYYNNALKYTASNYYSIYSWIFLWKFYSLYRYWYPSSWTWKLQFFCYPATAAAWGSKLTSWHTAAVRPCQSKVPLWQRTLLRCR